MKRIRILTLAALAALGTSWTAPSLFATNYCRDNTCATAAPGSCIGAAQLCTTCTPPGNIGIDSRLTLYTRLFEDERVGRGERGESVLVMPIAPPRASGSSQRRSAVRAWVR